MKSANLFRVAAALMAATLALTVFPGCGGEEKASAPSAGPAKSSTTFFPISIGGKVAQLQIAALPSEQTQGLMHRRDLKPDDGMLFVFKKPERMRFYMRNTPTPLDIGYFTSDGVLREVYPMYPRDETTVPSQSEHIQYCIEMNQGWYAQNNIRPGARLDLNAVATALRARGLEPKSFGLSEAAK